MTHFKRALWAVDPFAKGFELQRSALEAFHLLTGGRTAQARVEPVYLLSVYSNHKNILSQLESEAIERFRALADPIPPVPYQAMLPLKVISSVGTSLRTQVQMLIQYAKESGSELMIASTRAKKGVYRWLVGSFAETLVQESDVPLLIVNPAWEPKPEIDEILFATDFSKESWQAYVRVIELAKSIDRPITLFHKIPSSNTTLFYSDLVARPMYEVTLQAQTEYVQAQGSEWQEYAKSKDVTTCTEIRVACTESPADAVLSYSATRNCLIAMAAKSGPIRTTLLGGTTGSVVRGALAPVWVIHPQPKRHLTWL